MADYSILTQLDSAKLERINFQYSLKFMPTGFELSELIKVYTTSDAVGIFFCGAMTLLTFFIFLLYIKNKEKIYLYYVLFLFFMLLYGSMHIEASSWFTGSLNNYIHHHKRLVEPVTILSFSFYILFCIELLEIQIKDQRLHRILYFWAIFNISYSILYFVFYKILLPIEHSIFLSQRLIIFSISFYCLLWIARKIDSPVKPYFMWGSIAYFIGSLMATIRYSIDSIPFSDFYSVTAPVYFELGILIETLFFALALGDRIYLLHLEKQKANEQLIQQLSINEKNTRERNKHLLETVRDKVNEVSEIHAQLREEEKIRINAEFEKNLAQAEMLARRLQINPHFLFNSLNAIKYLIQSEKSQRAIKYLIIFSRFMRKVLDTSQKNVISLESEFTIIKDFLELEKNRFDNEFNYEIIIKDPCIMEQVYVPPLILQPFIENAIWHGLLTSDKIEKKIKICVFQNDLNEIVIMIDDNGIGREQAKKLTKAKLHKSLGISLTEERIKLYNHSYNSYILYSIIDKKDKHQQPLGTRVEFKIENKNINNY